MISREHQDLYCWKEHDLFWEAWKAWRELCVRRYVLATMVRWSPIKNRVIYRYGNASNGHGVIPLP
jgi:hypothetical protein